MGILNRWATAFAKRNNYVVGGLFALIFPTLLWGLFYILNQVVVQLFHINGLPIGRLLLAAIALNVVPMRMFYVKWNLEKIAQGILAITFVLGILFFVLVHAQRISIPN